MAHVAISDAFTCIGRAIRTHRAQAAGVACYVKHWLAPYAKCVLTRPDEGVVWIKLSGCAGMQAVTLSRVRGTFA